MWGSLFKLAGVRIREPFFDFFYVFNQLMSSRPTGAKIPHNLTKLEVGGLGSWHCVAVMPCQHEKLMMTRDANCDRAFNQNQRRRRLSRTSFCSQATRSETGSPLDRSSVIENRTDVHETTTNVMYSKHFGRCSFGEMKHESAMYLKRFDILLAENTMKDVAHARPLETLSTLVSENCFTLRCDRESLAPEPLFLR
jgi:hypothetical protein